MPEFLARDGVRIAYDDVGQGRPLLLVHGWDAHAGFFHPQLAGLSGRFRVVAPDLRGHRRSRDGADGLTVELLARDVLDLMAHLDLSGAVAVGWSMGAMVLWRALLDGAAERIDGMVVVDMSPRVPNGEGWGHGMARGYVDADTPRAQAAMKADWAAYSRRVARRLVAQGMPERAALAGWAAAEFAANDPAAMAQLWASLTGQDFRAELAAVETPTLILHGRRSQLYGPGTAAFLEKVLPRARRVAFDRSGHAPHLEEPDLFNRTIEEFAAGLSAGPNDGIARRSDPAGALN
ncbi:MAG TPA: alpha/beta hydrolase [Azospirillaceae bacterium]|nr:alpha/beta hydrolase [Azospirillaceae bacterium]